MVRFVTARACAAAALCLLTGCNEILGIGGDFSLTGGAPGAGGASAAGAAPNGGDGAGGDPQAGGSAGGDQPGGAGGEGGGPAGCDPRTGDVPTESCGLFVDTAASGAQEGTRAAPYQSVSLALAAATEGTAVYICSSPIVETATLDKQLSLFGAMDCTSWALTPTKTEWTTAANEVPLRLDSGANDSLLYGLAITSQTATGADATTRQGRSSVALLINGADVTIEECALFAGGGAVGANGEDQMGQAPGRQSMASSFNGNDATGCNGSPPLAKTFACAVGTTTGGAGGAGGLSSGNSGSSGQPFYPLGEPNGSSGVGDSGSPSFSCAVDGGQGENGHDGPDGNPGPGGVMLGAISAQSLHEGDPGDPGDPGQVGQGGGGGGGRKGNGANTCATNVTGPSGSGGGAGGCGGAAGGGGGAGGSSIALMVLSSAVTLTNVAITASDGGGGGTGGNRQLGGIGGFAGGAGPVGNSCSGGAGGDGGDGAPGGGGRGGHSIGIAYIGTAPVFEPGSVAVAADAAAGGLGGDANAASNQGAAGLTAPAQVF